MNPETEIKLAQIPIIQSYHQTYATMHKMLHCDFSVKILRVVKEECIKMVEKGYEDALEHYLDDLKSKPQMPPGFPFPPSQN